MTDSHQGLPQPRRTVAIIAMCFGGLVLMIDASIAAIVLPTIARLPGDPAWPDIAWRLWLCGAGFGMFFSPNARRIIGSAPQKRAAPAGSMTTTTRMLGQATGATLMAGLLSLGLGDTMAPILVAFSLVAVAGLISGARLLRTRRAP